MRRGSTPDNFIRLMTSFSIDIAALPDDLKCVECKSVLKGAYQVVPCGCRFCHTCVDHVMRGGAQFCPGSSLQCGGTHLLTAHQDSKADYSIGKLIGRCPQTGCSHDCPLVDMEGHLLVCPKKIEKHSPRELGCPHNDLPPLDTSGPAQQESLSQGEILIGMVDDMRREMEMQKHELVLKDDQMRTVINKMKRVLIDYKSIKDQIKSIGDENKSIKSENESINAEKRAIKDQIELLKRENEDFSHRVRQLSRQVRLKINERPATDEPDCASVTDMTGALASNLDGAANENEPVADEFQSINRADCQLIQDNIDFMNSPMQSIWEPMAPGRVDASCSEWLIESDLTDWNKGYLSGILREFSTPLTSASFTGSALPYTYQLLSRRGIRWGVLRIRLRILGVPCNSLLKWPFKGAVTITVSERDRRESCSSQVKQCQIARPPENQYRESDVFEFRQSELIAAGLDLRNSMCVSCEVAPVRTCDTFPRAQSLTSCVPYR